MLKYYYLVKPGIVRGNVLAAAAGYLLASRWHIDWVVFVAMIGGMSLVIACACVLNNYVDRGIDKKMARTKHRALVTGAVSARAAMWYAALLGAVGFAILISWTNWYVVGAGLIGIFSYVMLYGYAKRTTYHGTLVGTISGSMPLVAGYLAVSDRIDLGAVLLFIAMTAWQMPHFYAIVLRRSKDYKAAGLPVLPLAKGVRRTKLEMMLYVFVFTISIVLLSVTHYAGATFLLVMAPLSLYWLWHSVTGLQQTDTVQWGGRMFGLSLVVLMTWSVMLSVGGVLV